MRLLIIAFVAIVAAPLAGADSLDARAQFAERRGLIEADDRCALFTPDVRNALVSGAAQARGALLRGGWTEERVQELEHAARNAAAARACDDARTLEAAARARDSYRAWARTPSLTLPGLLRAWRAQRRPDAAGWLLVQDIPAPRRAQFGVRPDAVALVAPIAASERPPASASLVIRDVARASAPTLSAPARRARGLEAGAPLRAAATRIHARERRIATVDGVRSVIFEFPPDVLPQLAALDPRESAILEVGGQRLLIEIGDFAAARTFLALAQPR
ncbi:MAG: hypothetical protein GC206_06120 [Alphaproteobacteria bacterium]|nr:hypothetical protein [Alphaproteobacteria bacterium]